MDPRGAPGAHSGTAHHPTETAITEENSAIDNLAALIAQRTISAAEAQAIQQGISDGKAKVDAAIASLSTP